MNTENMTISEMEQRLSEVAEEIASIKTQIDFAKSDAAANGEYSNRIWFNNARHALRMKTIENQNLMLELGKRRKSERKDANDTFERRFMDVAKKRLDYSLFMEFIAEAKGE